jgi:hypothetical protein
MTGKSAKAQEAVVPGLAKPARRALAAAGITRLQHFSKFTEGEIAALHGMGPNALDKIRRALREAALGFAGPKGKLKRPT